MTHGFVVDEQSRKMSKSLGNGLDPMAIINGQKAAPGLGADVLRFWVASGDYTDDMAIGDGVLKAAAEAVRKVRNTMRSAKKKKKRKKINLTSNQDRQHAS